MAAVARALLRGAAVAATLAVDAAAPPMPRPSALAVQLEKKTQPNRLDSIRRRLTVGAVEVADCENVEYTGVIGLGTPVQEFQVILSIVSGYLWVANTECMACQSLTGGYDSSLSSTHEEDGSEFVISAPDGQVEAAGFLSVDVLSVAGVSTAVAFGEMTEANLEGCTTVDGLMGMGLTNEDDSNAFEDMVAAGAVEVPIFSFFMGNIDNDSPKGMLTLGGVNQTHYEGCLEWVHVSEAQGETSELPGSVPDGFWSVMLKDLKVASESILRSEATAVIDTGTSLIEGPFDDVGAIAGSIGATCITFSGSSGLSPDFVDCVDEARQVQLIFMECEAEFDDINFYFGGEDFALTSKDLLEPLTDFEGPNPSTAADPLCLFGMIGADMVDAWVLGDPFLRSFYTAYNVADKTVGLARATNSRTSSECDADASISSSGPASAGGDGDSGNATGDEIGGGPSATGSGSGGGSSSSSSGGDEQTSVVAVGVAAGLVTMGLILCAVVVFAVRQRFNKAGGAYRPTVDDIDDDGDIGGFEMSSGGEASSSTAVREGDFLQVSPRTGVRGGTGADATGAAFGRLLGEAPQRAGFAAFENAD